jgi:hypothetical protein
MGWIVVGIGFLIAPAKSRAFNAEIAEDAEGFGDFFCAAEGGAETTAEGAIVAIFFSAILA